MAGYEALLNNPPLATLSFASFTGPQDLTSSTTQPIYQMPAHFLTRGSVIKTTAGGNFSSTGTPTYVFGVYFGSTVLGVNVALTTASGAATLPWQLETFTTIQAAGSSGSAITQGRLWYGTTFTAIVMIPIPGIALVANAIDTTAATQWSVKATCSSSNSANIVTCSTFMVEHRNLMV